MAIVTLTTDWGIKDHYLASVKKINANGIKYITEMVENNMDENNKALFLNIVEEKMEKLSTDDIKDIELL